MELRDKVAVITGASSGIGKATAEKLLQAGMKVAGWQRSDSKIKHENFIDIRCDVSQSTDVQNALVETINKFGNVHVLINNSGVGYFGKMHEMNDEQWHEMFDVNVHGIFNATKSIVPLMIKNNFGHIINISSIAGRQAVVEGAGYSATKFAVAAISSSLFRELRQYNIKVSVIYPGSTDTKFFNNLSSTTLRREDMIKPKDVASSIFYLLTTPDDYLPFELEVRTMRAK